jgi:beta-glucosidase-like glycosyl hydrolase
MHCVGSYQGCHADVIPAPGVPAVRPLDQLVAGPTPNMTVAGCADACAVKGYPLAGVTSDTLVAGVTSDTLVVEVGMYKCYCGCSINAAAPPAPTASCSDQCPGAPPGDGPCGSNAAMATFEVECSPALKPSATCGNGTKPLPPGPACSQAATKKFKFCDVTLPLGDRVNDLVDRIELHEAGGLMQARSSAPIPRLGIPAFYWGTNAIHGVQSAGATSFPQALNMGCTWNRTVMRAVGRTIGREMRALNNLGRPGVGLTSWSPTINLIRDPRWGRNQETVSEDPFLTGEYGAQFSLGMQYDWDGSKSGPAPTTPISGEFMAVATLKHVLGYSLDQWSPSGNWSDDVYDRTTFDAVINDYDMSDTYTQPHKRAIQYGGAAGIMYACNMVNKVPAVASTDLAGKLRSWGFTGYRTTDGDGIGALADPHRQNYTKSVGESIKVAMTDGETDIDDGPNIADHLLDAVEDGLNETTIKRALFNTFRTRFRLGLFDPVSGQKWLQLGMKDVGTPVAQQLNKEASRQSLVLLQNRNMTLPFPFPTSGEVVVIGGSANSTRLLGGGHYAMNLPIVDGFETGGFPGIPGAISALLRQRAGASSVSAEGSQAAAAATVRYLPGIECSPRTDSICRDPKANQTRLSEAMDAAAAAAQVVLVLNLQSRAPCDDWKAQRDGGEFNPCGYESEQHDRFGIGVPKHQEALAQAVLAATRAASVPTAVVLVHGGALAIESLLGPADAILDAHYPSETVGAEAVADALYGRFSPAGKLPYTIMPKSFINISNFTSMDMAAPPGRTYKYYPTDPAKFPAAVFPFGWGLTYSRFNLTLESALTGIKPTLLRPGGAVEHTVRVSNTGTVDSDEVVQVYFAPQFTRPGVPTPKRQLVDFERVHVAAGASVSVPFTVSTKQLELVGVDGKRGPVAGHYRLVFTNGVDATATADVIIDPSTSR